MECKEQKELFGNEPNTVLIETLWNVKNVSQIIHLIPLFVLIETLWNVKELAVPGWARMLTGFNRNIVECKDESGSD